MSQQDWDKFYLKMATDVAAKSKDRSTKVGCVIVGPDNEVRSIGFNGFPRGVDDAIEDRHQRPGKYLFTEHAERNACFNAARVGIPLKGCKIYLNFRPGPCADCARAIIQSGITELITTTVDFPGVGNWADSLNAGLEMLNEAGVTIREVAL